MFTIHGKLLPSCGTYAEAVSVYENAHQGKRMLDGWRGLKDKRDTSKLVCMTSEGKVLFRYHHTVLVERSVNEVSICTYDSPSSVVFANSFLPDGVYTRSYRGEMVICVGGGMYRPRSGYLRLVYDGQWKVDEQTARRDMTEILDRKKAAKIRKVVAPLLEWAAALRRMGALSGYTTRLAEGMRLLRAGLNAGEIPLDAYRPIASALILDKEDLLPRAYVLGGAVSRELLPLGVLMAPTRYAAVFNLGLAE